MKLRFIFGRLFKRPIISIEQKLQRDELLARSRCQKRLLSFNRWRRSLGITTAIGSSGNIVKW